MKSATSARNKHLANPVRAYAASVFIIGLCVTILQYHSITFWNTIAGDRIGWVWSITIEAIGLWMWVQKSAMQRYLGVVASIILLAGPIFLLGADLAHHQDVAQETQAAKKEIGKASKAMRVERKMMFLEQEGMLKQALEDNRQTIKDFRENSKDPTRSGWSKQIAGVMEANARLRDELSKLYDERAKWQASLIEQDTEIKAKQEKAMRDIASKDKGAKLAFIDNDMSQDALFFLVGLQMVALVLLQIANVIAMVKIGKTFRARERQFEDKLQSEIDTEQPLQPSVQSGATRVQSQARKTEGKTFVAKETAAKNSTLQTDVTDVQAGATDVQAMQDEFAIGTTKSDTKATKDNKNSTLQTDATDVQTDATDVQVGKNTLGDNQNIAVGDAPDVQASAPDVQASAPDVQASAIDTAPDVQVGVYNTTSANDRFGGTEQGKIIGRCAKIRARLQRMTQENPEQPIKDLAATLGVDYRTLILARNYDNPTKRKPSAAGLSKIERALGLRSMVI